MGFISLCDGDPVVEYLRSTFGANIVRIPRASLRPPEVVAARQGRARTMGHLGDILAEKPPFVLESVDVHEEQAPPVLARKTRAVGFDLGLEILGGLLQGFGLPKAGLGAAFAPQSSISFSFHDVRRVYVEPNRLGRLLRDHAIDRANPATSAYFAGQDPWRLLLIDSVLTSPGFTVAAKRSSTESAHVDLPVIQQLVSDASAKVKVSSSASSEVSFTGEERLTFAFTCLEVSLDAEARIVGLAGSEARTVIQGLTGASGSASQRVTGVLLSDNPGLLDLDSAATLCLPPTGSSASWASTSITFSRLTGCATPRPARTWRRSGPTAVRSPDWRRRRPLPCSPSWTPAWTRRIRGSPPPSSSPWT
jgi:hypothetical protein